jgi:hypothetical protein
MAVLVSLVHSSSFVALQPRACWMGNGAGDGAGKCDWDRGADDVKHTLTRVLCRACAPPPNQNHMPGALPGGPGGA